MLTVGITIHLHATPGASIWSNGGSQNCIFLWMCLRAAGLRALLINCGDALEAPPAMMLAGVDGLEVHRFDEVVDQLDVLIECGSQVSAQNVAKVRARGGRCIAYRFGNAYVLDLEAMLYKPGTDRGSVFNGACFDEVWTNSQHLATCGRYWETLYRCPVRVMPHIWEPTFIDAAIREMPEGVEFGYKPGRTGKRLSIFEPNIDVVKAAIVPLLVCDVAFRKRPDLVEQVWCTNTHGAPGLKDHATFVNFAMALDLQRQKKPDGNPLVSFEARFNTPFWLAKNTDVVVSHQWENARNYLYYDALYGGYPLVHNADLPRGVGYRYEGFDCVEGGQVLLSALIDHDRRAEEYKETASKYLDTVRATSKANVATHRRAIKRLFPKGSK